MAEFVVFLLEHPDGLLVGVGQWLDHSPRRLNVLAHGGYLLSHLAQFAAGHLGHAVQPLARLLHALRQGQHAALRTVETGVELFLVEAESDVNVSAVVVVHLTVISCC